MKHETFSPIGSTIKNIQVVFILSLLVVFSSCSEQYWPDRNEMKEEVIDNEEKMTYPFCDVNLVWIKPHNNAVGGALQFRNNEGTSMALAVDVMEQGDSVFRFFPNVLCDTSNYRLQYRGATGNLIEEVNVSFADENGNDERVIVTEMATYYLQLTWKLDTVSKWDVLLNN